MEEEGSGEQTIIVDLQLILQLLLGQRSGGGVFLSTYSSRDRMSATPNDSRDRLAACFCLPRIVLTATASAALIFLPVSPSRERPEVDMRMCERKEEGDGECVAAVV